MSSPLQHDAENLDHILQEVVREATRVLGDLPRRPVARQPHIPQPVALPSEGLGFQATLEQFRARYAGALSGSAGPRYLGFVTGGATPAALAGDWLVSTFDQNVAPSGDSAAPLIERETLGLLRTLFGLSGAHSGSFVTGATMSNFVGLALARQWWARAHGRDAAQEGLTGLPPLRVLSGAPHSSVYKALSMLGLGRGSVEVVPVLPGREAVDLAALEERLNASGGEPCVVVANAGTVNTVDFDDLTAIAALRERYGFWLHVDAAFGAFAACSPEFRHLTAGLDLADSVTVDAHKWLNVPYDAAMQFTRHPELQVQVFQNSAAYLGLPTAEPDFVHLTPENSRRLRALPAWFTLLAYGAQGYREIVERNVVCARDLGGRVATSSAFQLLAPVRLNVVCFALSGEESDLAGTTAAFLARLRDDGQVFLTPTVYGGTPGIRAAFSNWRTTTDDVEVVWAAMEDALVPQRAG